jgi:hypothetical protein
MLFHAGILQGRTNPGKTTAPSICGSSMWNLLRITLLAPRILRWLLDFQKICVPQIYCVSVVLKLFLLTACVPCREESVQDSRMRDVEGEYFGSTLLISYYVCVGKIYFKHYL